MTGNVYFVRCGEFVKIGYANDVRVRVGDLQVGSPHQLELIAVLPGVSKSMEFVLHRAFDSTRVRGEWFRIDDRMNVLIAAINLGLHPENEYQLNTLLVGRKSTRKERQKVRAEYFARLAAKKL